MHFDRNGTRSFRDNLNRIPFKTKKTQADSNRAAKMYVYRFLSYNVLENFFFSITTRKETAKMNTEITIVLRSVTHAMKGKKLLYENGIRSVIVKPSHLEEGCGYGLSVASAFADAAAEILAKNKVRIVKIIRF